MLVLQHSRLLQCPVPHQSLLHELHLLLDGEGHNGLHSRGLHSVGTPQFYILPDSFERPRNYSEGEGADLEQAKLI